MRSLLLSALLAATVAGPTSAVELIGGTATLEWRNATGGETHQTHFTGGVELSFGAGFGTQLSVKNTNYAETPADFGSFGYELHAIWRPQVEGLALGVFYGEEDYDPWYQYAGIEAKYEASGFSAEGAVLDYSGPGYDATHTTLELGYQIGERFDVFAGYSQLDDDDTGFAVDVAYIGGSAKVAAGVSVFAKYSSVDEDGNEYENLGLGLRYDFGQGVTFQQRSYNELLPND